uniref:DNA-directed RNA polymerase subunit beta'' n=1 Tax=Polytrichum commune TaxID=3213 RepID=A0A8A9Y1Y1_POLCU|nr:RNA polymerase beta'' subunit [Polytrichum commune]QTT78357.1 RNA polymerase beta'' subunit [Polytrichum commune]
MAESVKMLFYNKVMDRTGIKQLIGRLISHFGITYTTHILDQLKTIGFQQATQAAISLGIDDLLTAPSKGWLIQDAEQQGYISEKHHRYGNVHAVEKLRQLIETWYATSEYLKQEMNPNFRMTDPLNPVHMMSFSGARGSTSQVHQLIGMRGLMSDPQGQIIDLPIQSNFREGLSLTEYIISCYGARKGVVDTAVRTSDAGYLTRRLVEVVQHIVVRKFDCGTFQGISVIYPLDSKRNIQSNSQQKLIGRVLSDHLYINNRCIAMRNQDITANLANSLINNFQIKPISIRSPLTCKSMLWICQLCYGWSLTHGNLIELGEAVGIIAGQSIGEPGTQLTLRTFHTGGVFTGDIAEHVRTPFNGTIKFDTKLVYPTRTRHGHPAWIFHNNLSVSIESKKKIHNLIIPPQSVLLVQNNQYVESKQIIAEVRAKISPFKEKVQKYIYSNLAGEMHWSTKVQHASEYIHSNVHLLRTAGHIWILSGSFYKYNESSFIFYRNQDKLDTQLPVAKQNLNYSKIKYIFSNKNWNFNYSNIILYTYSFLVLKKKEKNFYFFRKIKKNEKNLSFKIRFKIPKNGILQKNDMFAILNDYRYKIKSSGTIKYGNIKIDLVNKKNEIFKDKKTKDFRPRYQVIKEGNFFFLPEEIYILDQSFSASSILIENNSFIQKGTKITSTIISKVTGLVKIKKKTNGFKIKILPGNIYYPKITQKFSKQNNIFIPPGEKIFEHFQYENWVYLEWVIFSKENSFFLIRPAIEYKITFSNFNNFKLPTPFFLDLFEKQKTIKIKTVHYILYEDDEEIEIVNNSNIYLVQSCLLLDWETKVFIKEAYISFIKIKINKNFKNFLQLNLIKYLDLKIEKKNNNIILKSLFSKEIYTTNQYTTDKNKLFSKDQGTIRIPSNKKQENFFFLILSPSNLFQTILFDEKNTNIKGKNIEKFFCTKLEKKHISNNINLIKSNLNIKSNLKKIIEDFNRPIQKTFMQLDFIKFFGLLGYLQNITKFFQPFPLIKYNTINFSILDSSKNEIQNIKWYFLDENKKVYKLFLNRKFIFDLLKWSFPLFFSLEKRIQLSNLGHFICEGLFISEYQQFYESGQIIAISFNSLILRLAKPYLATGGATIHNNYGEIIKEGDTLITLVYERLKSGDIIQGLPKVEQLLEARPINSVSINLEKGFEDWNKDMTKFFGSLWGFFLSARVSMEQSQIHLVDQIQKVYRSQSVQISDKHIEIIVRQMTSKVLTLEDGMTNGFLPGELIEFSKAKRMNRALEEVIPYKPVLLGITKASLNTQSFISEASFQETTRVLAKAALRGRIDWLKGLKENVILGGIVPAGTGCQEVIWQITLEKQKNILLKKKKIQLFHNKVKDVFLYQRSLTFYSSEIIHKKLKQQLSEIHVNKYI